jgi:subtilase family serine protease
VLHRFKLALLCASVISGLAIAMPTGAAASPTSQVVGKPDAGKPVSFTVSLPLRNMDKLQDLLVKQQTPSSPLYHQWLTPAEFGLRFGPTTADMTQAVNALRARGFEVTTHTRSLSVKGSPALIEQAFSTSLQSVRGASGHVFAAAATPMRMPAELASLGARAFGLEGIEHHSLARSLGKISDASPDNRFSPNGPYYYTDLKQAYVYPSYTSTVTVGGKTLPYTGVGATIGTVISSDVLDSDVQLIFDHEKFSTTTGTPDPTLYLHRYVNGGAPFAAGTEDSFEASLDVQQEITGAPGSHVILYDINSLNDSDIIDGYTAVIDDNKLDAVSSSFGECELYYTPAYNNGFDYTPTLAYYHELYLQGNAQGITFLASSGDSAGLECISTSYFRGHNGVAIAGVSTPATDPAVTAVGGTNVVTTYDVGTLDSGYSTENAWLDQEVNSDPYGFGGRVRGQVWGAGGGASTLFAAPDYQSLVKTGSTMRTTPDIGMQVGGCPGGAADYNPTLNVCNGGNKTYNGSGNTNRSAVVIGFGGSRYAVIGTSVSSPEFTGALALLIEKYGRMGNLNYYIYKLAARQAAGGRRAFHTMIPGYNGVMQSNVSSTYNVSTGVGTPIVDVFLGGTLAPPAGLPQTPSNP